MEENRERCCGTCKWHQYDDSGDDLVCANSGSEYWTDYTDYEDGCEEWESRK
ncbi:hypothetical protein [Flintibacter muris]|uniref:hypothetical protein n=1 Tax=Flintibacter muris TaxID=2941327 RepID=UPI0020418AAF|nr:hypothetical protein [Flintibacter muris]